MSRSTKPYLASIGVLKHQKNIRSEAIAATVGIEKDTFPVAVMPAMFGLPRMQIDASCVIWMIGVFDLSSLARIENKKTLNLKNK